MLTRSRGLIAAAWTTLITQVVIVGTGGAVRLTGSGLGCSQWPNCTPESFTPVPEQGIHGIIEFANRVWGGIVVVVAIVMLVMPLALSGGLIGLWLLNLVTYQSLDMLTMIGFIILLGLVVNNAILLVAETRDGEARGLSLRDAVEASVRVRARPVYMSTLTTIVGMLPLVLMPGTGSDIYRGLATVIVGGMLFSFLFTLVLMPAMLRISGARRDPAYDTLAEETP